jgi:hypothetical protein
MSESNRVEWKRLSGRRATVVTTKLFEEAKIAVIRSLDAEPHWSLLFVTSGFFKGVGVPAYIEPVGPGAVCQLPGGM